MISARWRNVSEHPLEERLLVRCRRDSGFFFSRYQNLHTCRSGLLAKISAEDNVFLIKVFNQKTALFLKVNIIKNTILIYIKSKKEVVPWIE